MPSSKQLAAAIVDRFLSSKFKNLPLMRVSETAMSVAGKNVFNDWIRDMFEAFEPTNAHKKLGDFRWRAVLSTNYDLLVEKAYGPGSLQKLVTRVKDDEPIETMLRKHSHPLEYVKLHGCVNHVHDKDIPLVLTPESYNDHEANRQDMYGRLESLGREYSIIFCGHSLDDLHIRRLVENPRYKSRPMYYLISPNFEPEETKMWLDKRVDALTGTFANFMDALDTNLTPLMRLPNKADKSEEAPYRKHFRVLERESDETRFAFQKELTYLHAGFKINDVRADRFYAGFDQSWGNIAMNYDVQRRASVQVLEYIGGANSATTQLCAITGPAGYGKTIALKRAAWELAISFGELVVWLDDDSKLRPDVLKELHDLSGKRIYVFSDRAGLNCAKVEEILALSKAQNIPLTLITAERRNEWSMYCQRLEKYKPEFFEIKKLSEREITELLEKLKLYDCEGILKDEPAEKQRDMLTERLDRQLLVALYEITRGKSFEEIVVDEYLGVTPEEAQKLYLDICTLHRFDVPVRAGVISRISDISFRDFDTELFEPLQDLVFTKQNSITGDWEYRTRHSVVSDMVFTQVCRSDVSRHDQIIRLIDGLDTSYRSDDVALSQLIRGKNIAEAFEDINLARGVYEVAIRRNPSKFYLQQQRAIFEYTHGNGNLEQAEQAVSEALEADPSNPSFLHTQAQVFRRMALRSDSEFARQALRVKSRATLDRIPNQANSYVLGSRARLRVDSVSDALDKLKQNPSVAYEDELADAIDQAELALHRAFNEHPSNPDFLEAESKLKDLMGDNAASTELLARAWRKMPRGSGVAKRLARRYLKDEKHELATSVLNEAIERNPSDRSVNLLLANIYFQRAEDLEDTNGHRYLAQSYVHGDREYFSRFVASAVMFARKQFEDAYSLIDEVEQRAPGDFYPSLGRMERWLSSKMKSQKGTITSSFGAYVFIKMRDCPKDIYAPTAGSSDDDWDELSVQSEVTFDIEFSRKGPVAMNVRKRL